MKGPALLLSGSLRSEHFRQVFATQPRRQTEAPYLTPCRTAHADSECSFLASDLSADEVGPLRTLELVSWLSNAGVLDNHYAIMPDPKIYL